MDGILSEFCFFKLGLENFKRVSNASKKIRILNHASFKSVEKVSKKKYFLNKKWTKSSCWCKVQKGSLSMQSSKKALGWIFGQKPGWILFFLNLVWELLKVVFNASKKIRTFYDASFKSFEKVSQKTKHFFNKKSKKNTWMNSWMESWINFVFFKLGLQNFKRVSKASKKIRILNDTSFKSVEKVSKKKKTFWTKSERKVLVDAKFKKSAWINSWTKA